MGRKVGGRIMAILRHVRVPPTVVPGKKITAKKLFFLFRKNLFRFRLAAYRGNTVTPVARGDTNEPTERVGTISFQQKQRFYQIGRYDCCSRNHVVSGAAWRSWSSARGPYSTICNPEVTRSKRVAAIFPLSFYFYSQTSSR
jgi:hypothetical protein